MRHAAHGAKKVSHSGDSFLSLFASSHGSHSASHVYKIDSDCGVNCEVNSTPELSVACEYNAIVSNSVHDIIPQTRREIRLARLATERRKRTIISASLIALVGAVMTSSVVNSSSNYLVGSKSYEVPADSYQSSVEKNSDSASRSYNRVALNRVRSTRSSFYENRAVVLNGLSTASSHNSKWSLNSDTNFDISELSRSVANNPQVALLMEADISNLPKGFNPNHDSGDKGNTYEFSQCTWWVYVRRHQLGLPVGSHMGDGRMWANSARALGYWVDRNARHPGDIMVFAPGQAGSDRYYGHVAIVEKVNSDGSIETSESGAKLHGGTFSRKFEASEISKYQFIHY